MSVDAYVWLILAGVLLALLGVAFAYLTLRRSLARVQAEPFMKVLRRFDRRLAEKAPGVRRHLRRRLTLRHWHGLLLTLAAAALFMLVWLFAAITDGWMTHGDLYQIDQAVHERLADVLGTTTIAFFQAITHLGDGITVAIIGLGVGVFLFYRRDVWRLAALVVAVGVGQGVLLGLKTVFARSRPDGKLIEAGFYSFPSGHSFSAMVLYGFLIFLVWRYVKREAVRIAATILLILVIAGVGASRVVLSVHWTSDVLGGFTVGLAWLVCALTATRALQAYRAAGPPVKQGPAGR